MLSGGIYRWNGSLTLWLDHDVIRLSRLDEVDGLRRKVRTFILSSDIIIEDSLAYAYDGKIYGMEWIGSLREGLGHADTIGKALTEAYGFYSLAFVKDECMVLARDPIGTRPLYYAKDDSGIAFSSDAKAISTLYPYQICSLKPGCCILLDHSSLQFLDFCSISKLHESTKALHYDPEHLAKTIIEKLRQSLSKMVDGSVCIAFSGGLDSSILVKLMMDIDFTPLCVGLRGSKDLATAESVAGMLGIELIKYEVTVDELSSELSNFLKIVDRDRLIDLSIVLSLYFVLKKAKELGFNAVISGQGADELFGGYKKYERVLASSGYKGLEQEMFKDLSMLYSTNLERDYNISLALSMELLYPYLDLEIVKLALSIPIGLKVVRENSGYLRKYILRLAAKMLNIPNEVVFSEKRAIQYGTGMWKALRRVFKRGLQT